MASTQLPILNQSPDQGLDLERGKPERQATLGTLGSVGSSSNTILRTRFTDMVFEPVPFLYTALSSAFMWIVLAGFLVLPTTFPNIQTILKESEELSKVLHVARNLPLLVLGFTCCGVGGIGLCLLWWRWSHNYVWLLSSIFIPGMFNGLSGLISTFVNLYGSQDGVHYGRTTIATIAATGGSAAICGFLTVIYSLRKYLVKRRHDRQDAREKSRLW